MDLKIKMWLEREGQNVMGGGRFALLRAIQETGSLREAASKLDISYRHAWGHIKKLEESAGFKFVDTTVGGRGGGNTKLTAQAEKFLDNYEKLRADISAYAAKKFKSISLG